jgi:Fe-S cluster biogenesis protein NfuA
MTAADFVKARVKQILSDEIGPALEMDETTIEVVGVANGVAQLRLHGACAGCPSSVMTLIMGIEKNSAGGSRKSNTSKPCPEWPRQWPRLAFAARSDLSEVGMAARAWHPPE